MLKTCETQDSKKVSGFWIYENCISGRGQFETVPVCYYLYDGLTTVGVNNQKSKWAQLNHKASYQHCICNPLTPVTVTDGFTTASLHCTHGLLSHFIGPAELH